MFKLPRIAAAFFSCALSATFAVAVAAQEMPGLGSPSTLAQQTLRPYWHVFIAYAIAIALVMVWAGSIAKRLSEIEDRLGD